MHPIYATCPSITCIIYTIDIRITWKAYANASSQAPPQTSESESLGRRCPVTHIFNLPRWFLCILKSLGSPLSSLGPWTNARWLFPCILWLYTFYQTHHRAAGKGTKLKIKAAFPGRWVAQRLEHHPEPRTLPSCWAEEEGSASVHLFSDRWGGLSGFL